MFLLGLFIGYFSIIDAQWRIRYEYLFSNVNFQERIRTDQMNYPFVHFTSSFMIPTQFDRTANFISCTNPETSYITLNSQYPQVQQYYCEIRKHFYSSSYYYDHYQSSFLKGFLSFDLYFQGTWTNGKVTFSIDLFTGEYLYNSPSTYALNSQFCDEIAYDIRTVNFTIPYNVNGDFLFGIQNTNENGQVSIRNIYQMYYEIICYPSCKSCTGPKQNECTACYFGTPTNNVCLPCPSDQYYVKNVGCRLKCDSIQPLCFNGFCNACPSNFQLGYVIVNQKISNDPNSYKDFLQWSKIYDPKFIDNSVDVFHYTKNGQNILLYGIFKQSSGIMRQVSISNVWGYYMKVKIMIIIFNGFPMDCGIQFKFMESSFFYFIFLMQLQQKTYEFDNNTLVGSIYKNSSGIQLHKFKEFQETSLGPYESYSSSYKYIIDGVFDLPKYTILFSAIGNFSDTSFGWAFQSIWFGTQRCTNNCQACDVNFKCTYCSSQTFRYRDGTCISTCNQPHQNIISDYCKDLDDETPYSQLLIREDVNHFELDYYPEYTLVSQRGQNFLKGPDIYFSYLKGLRIFGGQFIWAQARFRRVHQNLGPHHSISIGFYVFFGPLFPSDGKFIYQIDQQDPLYTSTLNAVTFQNGTKQQIIRKKINHSLNHLILELECFGENNEVQQAYCGFYNYYLAIHYCQPFCLQCTDEKTCTNWNSTYNPSLIQFSQDECQTNQYFDVYQLLCVNCEPSCSTCKSKTVCLTCINPTYTLTKVGCFCKLNQIEESNQCVNCPIECNQCSSSSYCTECLSINNRKLLNGQCICIDGYYQKDQDIICSLCDKFCGTCFGPTSNDCLTCNIEVLNIQLIESTCKCPTNSFYQNSYNTCTFCHTTCLTCLNDSIDGCLTCDSQQNRQLQGLKCTCTTGFYTQNNICIQCPNNIDVSLLECYKYCDNGDLIWNTNTCNTCGQGFNLISNECVPICGDLLVVGYEQCDDGNNILDDKCYNCQFQCPINCQTCDINTILPCPDICGDGLITGDEECEDGNDIQFDGCFDCKYQCQTQCTKCIKGKCSECATLGWQIDVSSEPWLCKEVCGDGLRVGIEECDDANFYDFDGCHNCKFLCRIGCSFCDYEQRKCLSCEFEGFQPSDYFCQPILNDGLLVWDPYGFFYERAHKSNRCDNCYSECGSCGGVFFKFECQPLECTSCVNKKCQACISGQTLSTNNICQPICGDNIKAYNEYCEDSHVLPYRGCQNCRPKCQDSCSKCDIIYKDYQYYGIGCLQCKDGYKLNDFLCYSKCGEFLFSYDKECDDGNLIPDDGCHFCQLNCQKSCLFCIKGVCLDCEEGYELIQSRCHPIINSFEQYKYSNDFKCLQSHKNWIMKNSNFGQNDNSSCKFCLINCEICNEESCISCVKGYYLNEQQQCQSECGDGILTQDEQCELNEQYCFNCKYIHPQYCQKSINNVCINCDDGYYFDELEKLCKLSCGDGGDGILIYNEKYQIQSKIDCKFQCSEDCLVCKNGFCQQCKDSFNIWNGQCHKVEKLIRSQLECKEHIQGLCIQCYEQYVLNLQGECIPSCQDSCVICKFGQCYECKESYYLYQNTCYPENECSLYFISDFSVFDITCRNLQSIEIQRNNQQSLDSDEISNRLQFLFGYDFDLIDSQFFENWLFLNKTLNGQQIQIVEDEIIQINIDNNDSDSYFNLQELNCNTDCLLCFDTQCIQCQIGYLIVDFSCVSNCGDSLTVGNEQCDDGNIYEYDGCYECQYQCQKYCEICERGNCIKCISNFVFDSLQQCRQMEQLSITQNQDCRIIQNNQCILCEHGNLESITGICILDYYLENQCIGHCNICLNQKCQQCEYGYYGTYCLEGDGSNLPIERCTDFNQQQSQICKQFQECNQNCIYCVNKICYLCNEGTYLFNNECIISKIDKVAYKSDIEPKCGDGIVQIYEECDDRNTKQFDGCFYCKFSCDTNCYDCFQGICQTCQDGFILNQNHLCDPLCGDNFVVPFSIEQCDDGNFKSLDGCYKCKYECLSNCLDCNQILCLKCEEGFETNKSYCVPICGDGIIIQQFEDCEDLNDEPYDGCYECKFQCRQNCKLCSQGVCLDECPEGMIYVGDICMPKKCIDNCQICEKGDCFECNIGYSYDGLKNQCIQDKLSDSSLNVSMIEMDENLYICRLTECVFSPAPILQVILINQTFSRQYVEIFFDQQVKLKFDEEELKFQFNFTNLKQGDYIITLHQKQPINYEINFASYIVEIENLASINEKPFLQIFCSSDVINSNNQTLQNKFASIKLNYPQILSNEQKQTSQFMQNTNKVFMYGAISVSLVSLFAGDSSFFLETLNVLQQQSFLKFINVDYPENLYIYFEASDMLSVNSYFSQLNLDYYYNFISQKTEPLQVNGKFELYDVDPDLIISLLPQVFQCSGIVLLLFLSRLIYRLFHLIMSKKQIYDYFNSKSQFLIKSFLTILNTLRIQMKNLINLRRNLNSNYIKIFFSLNAWDILFKSILQIRYTQFKQAREYIQLIGSFLLIYTYGSYMIEFLRKKGKSENKYDFESRIFLSLDLCRKFIYHFVLIFFQECPTLQFLFLSIISLSQCLIISKYEQSSILDKIISILNEGTIAMFSLTCFPYNDINRIYFSNETIKSTGFIHMGLLLLNLIIVLFKQLLIKLQFILKGLYERKQPEQIKNIILNF